MSLLPCCTRIPNPVTRSPGSMPRMRRTGASMGKGLALSLVEHGRRIDVLYVVERFERIQQLLHARRVVAGHFDFGGGFHRHFGEFRLEAGFGESILDGDELVWS